MNHLTSSWDMGRIENNLLQRRDELAQATSWVFNLVSLAVVLMCFAYFLYIQYQSNKDGENEEKRIPFEPQTWYSATRNLRSEDYGSQLQPFEIETRHGLP